MTTTEGERVWYVVNARHGDPVVTWQPVSVLDWADGKPIVIATDSGDLPRDRPSRVSLSDLRQSPV